jgi:plastocyanin
MKNPLLVIVPALILIGVASYFLMPKGSGKTPPVPAPSTEIPEGATIITLTEDGFTPSEVTVKRGTTVAFVSENGKLFWPASNLHPSHALYPEFDPKLPIQSDEAWSFTFTKVGEWKYHDHLAPYYTGVITVTE